MQLHTVSMQKLHDTGQATLLQVLEQSIGGSIMNAIICVKHRYIDQMGRTPCPECEEVE